MTFEIPVTPCVNHFWSKHCTDCSIELDYNTTQFIIAYTNHLMLLINPCYTKRPCIYR